MLVHPGGLKKHDLVHVNDVIYTTVPILLIMRGPAPCFDLHGIFNLFIYIDLSFYITR